MFTWLEKIRNQSVGKRRLVAIGVALLITGIVFIVWFLVWLPAFLSDQKIMAKNEQFEGSQEDMWSTFSQAWNGVTDQYGELKTAVTGINLSSAIEYTSTSTAISN